METPDEIVRYGVAHTDGRICDFMVRSSIDLLEKQGVPLERITALDPFTGNGVFLESLLRHGIKGVSAYEIRQGQCAETKRKYGDRVDVCCADAFEMRPSGFNLIIGNPPYGKCAENAEVDARIRKTYGGSAVNQQALFDGYVRAIRWASDHLERGVISYIVNSGFLEGIAFANFRKSVEREFLRVYVVNLRGNHRTSGERCRKEGGNVFGNECRTGIAVLFLER